MNQPSNAADVYQMEAVVESFENKFAILKLGDGQIVRWPIKVLPEDAAVGATVRLVVRTSKSESIEREALAKTMLNEILKNDS